METIFGAIHGTYAYLLIFQILVVTLLFLTLLWLVVKRTKEGALYAGIDKAAPAEMVDSAAVANVTVAYAPVGAEAQADAGATIAVAGERTVSNNDSEKTALAEKVKFLESKLLEYEILQEEIGTLGALKAENEKLKQRLVGFESGNPPPPNTGAPTADVHEAVPQQSPKELAQQLASAFDGNAVFTENPSAAAPAAATSAQPTPMPEAKKQPDLDDLLSQIDSLTSDKH